MESNQINKIALFIDYDNIGLSKGKITKLIAYVRKRGRLIVKMAYADWSNFDSHKKELIENSIDLIEMPSNSRGKNAADIKLAVDAMEVARDKPYIDTVIIAGGDSDYMPLISKLREYDKYVIVIAQRNDVSKRLTGYSDEVVVVNDITEVKKAKPVAKINLKGAYALLKDSLEYLLSKSRKTVLGQVKSQMLLSDPSFNENALGFDRFMSFLKKAADDRIVYLEKDKNDTWVYLFDEEKALESEIEYELAHMDEAQLKGVIVRLGKKPFGFIELASTRERFYFTHKDVLNEGFRNLREGQRVSFTAHKTKKQYNRAKDVQVLG